MIILRPFDAFRPFSARGASETILQPIALISPTTGAVFVNADGKVLTRGTKRVKPQGS